MADYADQEISAGLVALRTHAWDQAAGSLLVMAFNWMRRVEAPGAFQRMDGFQ